MPTPDTIQKNTPEPKPQPAKRGRALLLHVCRVALFCVVIWLIHDQHQWHLAQQQGETGSAITLERAQQHFPDAHSLSDWQPSHGGRDVLNAAGDRLGFVIQTSPKSDAIVGFSGPTNTLIAIDDENRIVSIEVLSSGDTKEHLADVVAHDEFMRSFDGLTWRDASERTDIDAVSGATLTSLAIAEGVIYRLGGAEPSQRFPDPPALNEVSPFFPSAVRLEEQIEPALQYDVIDSAGTVIGTVMRTSPAADQVIGYQGPTDTLIAFDTQMRIKGIALRRSYDNEPYVQYVRDEAAFLELFNGKSLDKLTTYPTDEVEGVSGATMTSSAVARGLVAAAAKHQAALAVPKQAERTIQFRSRDIGTIAVIAIALLIAFTPLKKHRALRVIFQLVLIVYLGFINGDMVSQSLMVGWSQSGVPYRFAPGMMMLVAAALLIPITTKKQLYCHELCPHGALQELLKNRLPSRTSKTGERKQLPRRLIRALEMLPAALLLWVVVVAMLHLPFSLVGIEPFDAYIIRIAGWATITVAVVGLIASLFVPMAYCRFGCPTGAMLKFLRFSGASDRFHKRDAVALIAVAIALAVRLT